MTIPPSGLQPRSWIYVWLLLLAPVWGFGLFQALHEVRWIGNAPPVCKGLGAYAAVAEHIPEDATLSFLTDAKEPTAARRYFCAQYELSPRIVRRWWYTPVFGRKLTGTLMMVHFDDLIARQTYFRDVVAEARRQGLKPPKPREPVPGILLLQVEEK